MMDSVTAYCFVMMPFANGWSDAVWNVIKGAFGDQRVQGRYRCERGDDIHRPGVVLDQVCASINAAWFYIADLTGRNANVFFELGISFALRRQTVLLAQSLADVVFDVRQFRVIIYDPATPGWEERLAEELVDYIASLESPAGDFYPLLQMLNSSKPSLLVHACRELGSDWADKPEVIVPLTRLLTHPDVEVASSAAWALGETRSGSAVGPLAAALWLETAGTEEMCLRTSAARALGRIGDWGAVPSLCQKLGDRYESDLSVKPAVADALGQIGDPTAISALQELRQEADPYLATTLDEALRRLTVRA